MFYPYLLICVKRRLPPVGKPGSSMRGGKRPKRKTKTSKLAKLATTPQKGLRRLQAEQGPERLSGKLRKWAVGCGRVPRRPTNFPRSMVGLRGTRPHPTTFRI